MLLHLPPAPEAFAEEGAIVVVEGTLNFPPIEGESEGVFVEYPLELVIILTH